MPGCKRNCSFSLKRNQSLKCEGECKTGYIESSEGNCSMCYEMNEGCHQCHYENEYPTNYTGIKRKRRFVCDYCKTGFAISPEGKCFNCKNLGINKCISCEINQNDNNNYICAKCLDDYFVNEKGFCQKCDTDQFKGINKNKCFSCSDTLNGGIDNCLYCSSDGIKVECKQCYFGYILLTNNNTCLNIFKNHQLQNFQSCDQLTLINNKLVCTKCFLIFSLIKKKNGQMECECIPPIYDLYFDQTYEYFYSLEHNVSDSYVDWRYREKDIFYQKYSRFEYCQEVENIGTDDNPLYTCTKCYEDFYRGYTYLKVTEKTSKLSYCIYTYSDYNLDNCLEATYAIINGKEIYNCTKCDNNYDLVLNESANTNICRFNNFINICSVLYCKECDPKNGYICNECLKNYEINNITGSCVKKTETVPTIYWKDIYKIIIFSKKIINNKYINGPSFRLRGITINQINERHAFLIYLTFKKGISLRTLEEEEIKIPGICEILKEVEEIKNDVNMVDYECIGNYTQNFNLSNYKLTNIEEGNNEGELIKSNLNSLASSVLLDNLETKIDPTFTLENLTKIIIFQMNEEIDNITANDFKFNFTIEGKFNKHISNIPLTIQKEFYLSEVDTKANCLFLISENLNANLSCEIDMKKHKNIKTFSFITSEINTDEGDEIYLAKLNNIKLINSLEKEKDKKNKTTIIIIIVICGIVVIVGLSIGIFFMVKKVKSNEEKKNDAQIEEKANEVKENDRSKNIILKN